MSLGIRTDKMITTARFLMLHQRAPELSRQRGPRHLSLPPRILIGVLFRVSLDGLASARPEGCGQRRRRHLPFFGNRENPFLRVLPRPVCERSRLRTDGKGLRTCCQPGLKRFEMLLPMVTCGRPCIFLADIIKS